VRARLLLPVVVVLCVTRVYALDVGIGLVASLGMSQHSSALTLGPAVCAEFPWRRATVQSEIHLGTLMGSSIGLSVKVFREATLGAWRPRIGGGVGGSINSRIIYTTSLEGMALPPDVVVSGIVVVDLFRLVFARSGVSILTVDVSAGLVGPAREWRAAVTLFRFTARLGAGRQRSPATGRPADDRQAPQ
jgi:hypothetical protein